MPTGPIFAFTQSGMVSYCLPTAALRQEKVWFHVLSSIKMTSLMKLHARLALTGKSGFTRACWAASRKHSVPVRFF
ncbi:hypothetical protein J6590_068935 [Homalodisca vitripennis]|nr:hypothetical protein J6590_068935 [Homalodisca vitripennis]